MAPNRPFVIQHVLDEGAPSDDSKEGCQNNHISAYTTWIHPIHNKLQDHLAYTPEAMEKMVEAMLKRRQSVPSPQEAAKLAVDAIREARTSSVKEAGAALTKEAGAALTKEGQTLVSQKDAHASPKEAGLKEAHDTLTKETRSASEDMSKDIVMKDVSSESKESDQESKSDTNSVKKTKKRKNGELPSDNAKRKRGRPPKKD
jgi:hypothetical protein